MILSVLDSFIHDVVGILLSCVNLVVMCESCCHVGILLSCVNLVVMSFTYTCLSID